MASSPLAGGKLPRLQMASQEAPRPVLTRAEVAKHCTADDCWLIVNDRVYEPTSIGGTWGNMGEHGVT